MWDDWDSNSFLDIQETNNEEKAGKKHLITKILLIHFTGAHIYLMPAGMWALFLGNNSNLAAWPARRTMLDFSEKALNHAVMPQATT